MPLTGPSQQTSACSLVLQADVFIFRPAQRRFFRFPKYDPGKIQYTRNITSEKQR